MAGKIKIVLDADVVIHFMKAGCFHTLLSIFPEYEYLILDVVYGELTKYPDTRNFIDNNLQYFGNRISSVKFSPKGESMKEYARLTRFLGRGESACMVYCRDNKDVLGSSNLKDIADYCRENEITYLTTLDFLYYAYVRKHMTAEECSHFIQKVIDSGSRLPKVDISTYCCTVAI